MNQFMFTLGFGQYDGRFNNCYFIVAAEDETEARSLVNSKIGAKWAFSYPMDGKSEASVHEYDMGLVTLEEVAEAHLALYPNDYPHNLSLGGINASNS